MDELRLFVVRKGRTGLLVMIVGIVIDGEGSFAFFFSEVVFAGRSSPT